MVFVGRRAFLSPEDLLARLAVAFDLVGLLFVFLFFVFLFFGMAAVYHCDRPVVCDVSDRSISRRFPGFLGAAPCRSRPDVIGLHCSRPLWNTRGSSPGVAK